MKSKYLFLVFVLIVIVSIIYGLYHFIFARDYVIYSEISCDPSIESCFFYECDESELGCLGEPYKKIIKNAKYSPYCDPYADDNCPELFCEESEFGCEIIECSTNELEEGESCLSQIN